MLPQLPRHAMGRDDSLQVTLYDKASSLLIALLILLSIIVAVLLGLWLSAQAFGRPRAIAVTLLPRGEGGGMPDSDQVDPNVLDPGLEFEKDEPTFLEAMESVVNVVSDNAAMFSDVSPTDDMLLTPGGKRGDGRTKGDGIGKPGRVRRWEFHFNRGLTVDEYAAMLDFFGIELGILRPGGKVVYISNLRTPKPTVREGKTSDEKRYYLTWLKGAKSGDTQEVDHELLAKAGVAHDGRLIVKFLPANLEAGLERLEQEYAKDRINAVKGSYFRIVRDNRGYRFQLYYQIY